MRQITSKNLVLGLYLACSVQTVLEIFVQLFDDFPGFFYCIRIDLRLVLLVTRENLQLGVLQLPVLYVVLQVRQVLLLLLEAFIQFYVYVVHPDQISLQLVDL